IRFLIAVIIGGPGYVAIRAPGHRRKIRVIRKKIPITVGRPPNRHLGLSVAVVIGGHGLIRVEAELNTDKLIVRALQDVPGHMPVLAPDNRDIGSAVVVIVAGNGLIAVLAEMEAG